MLLFVHDFMDRALDFLYHKPVLRRYLRERSRHFYRASPNPSGLAGYPSKDKRPGWPHPFWLQRAVDRKSNPHGDVAKLYRLMYLAVRQRAE